MIAHNKNYKDYKEIVNILKLVLSVGLKYKLVSSKSRSLFDGSDSSSDDEVTTHVREGSVKAPLGPEVYTQWFREADKNGDGFLTAKELKKMFKARGIKTKSKAFKVRNQLLWP